MGSATQAACLHQKEYAEELPATKRFGSNKTRRRERDRFDRRRIDPDALSTTLRPNTVLEVSARSKVYERASYPNGARFIEVIQAALRYVGVRWNMPEYMISGRRLKRKPSLQLVAERRSSKARQADQLVYSNAFRGIVFGKCCGFGSTPERSRRKVGSFAELQSLIYLKIDRRAWRPAIEEEIAADRSSSTPGQCPSPPWHRTAQIIRPRLTPGQRRRRSSTPVAVDHRPNGLNPKEPGKPERVNGTLNHVASGSRRGSNRSVADLAKKPNSFGPWGSTGPASSMIAATKKLPTPSTEQPSASRPQIVEVTPKNLHPVPSRRPMPIIRQTKRKRNSRR